MSEKNYFQQLNDINVNDKAESKNGLTYLSWAWAWTEVKKLFPDSNYTIYEDPAGCFYFTDGKTCWVKTGVTVNGIEHIEYLPVMDFKNRSIPADAVTSFDVNKAIQRSLTKAIARHGLGLYIYAGEDLPESEAPSQTPAGARISDESAEAVRNLIKKGVITYEGLEKRYGVYMVERLTEQQAQEIFAGVKAAIEKKRKERTETA